jgi:hypothetical protein
VRSKVTRDYYLRRLRIFFNHINLLPNGTMEERCNLFASNGVMDPSWTFHSIISFLRFEKERVESEQITGATLRNYVKAIKLFCEMADVPVAWRKITRGLPKSRRFADDRAPTLEEIQRICDYPDRRIKAIVCTMSSSGIRAKLNCMHYSFVFEGLSIASSPDRFASAMHVIQYPNLTIVR